jgi:hypothetical protein
MARKTLHRDRAGPRCGEWELREVADVEVVGVVPVLDDALVPDVCGAAGDGGVQCRDGGGVAVDDADDVPLAGD